MVKFASRIALFLALVAFTYGVLLIVILLTPDTSGYFASAIDKHKLLETTPSPKIIMVGGSSLALSVDSSTLQANLGLPVVNMGIHGGLGLRYVMEEVRAEIKPGDWIIVYPEYQSFYGFFNGDDSFIALASAFPEGIRYISSPRQVLNMFKKLPISMQGQVYARLLKLFYGEIGGIYTRRGFDANGDLISPLGEPANTEWMDKPLFGPKDNTFEDEAIGGINAFADYAHCQGAHVVVIFATISDFHYRDNETKLLYVYTRLKSEGRIDYLSIPTEEVLPASFFYDSPYHLNADGRKIKTAKMLGDLRQTMTHSQSPQEWCRK